MQDTNVTAKQRQRETISTGVVRAAAVQISPVLNSCEGTIDKVIQKYHTAVSQPEYAITKGESRWTSY